MKLDFKMQKLSVSKLVRLTNIQTDRRHVDHLIKCHQKSKSDALISRIKQTIFPIKVMQYKKEMYALEWIMELEFLSRIQPECECEVVIIKRVKDLNVIRTRIADHVYCNAFSSYGATALYGLEKHWQKNFGYSPLMDQLGYCQALKCNRSTLARSKQSLTFFGDLFEDNKHTDAIQPSNNSCSDDFSWGELTSHIPDVQYIMSNELEDDHE